MIRIIFDDGAIADIGSRNNIDKVYIDRSDVVKCKVVSSIKPYGMVELEEGETNEGLLDMGSGEA
jgi:hypothetical protein